MAEECYQDGQDNLLCKAGNDFGQRQMSTSWNAKGDEFESDWCCLVSVCSLLDMDLLA